MIYWSFQLSSQKPLTKNFIPFTAHSIQHIKRALFVQGNRCKFIVLHRETVIYNEHCRRKNWLFILVFGSYLFNSFICQQSVHLF